MDLLLISNYANHSLYVWQDIVKSINLNIDVINSRYYLDFINLELPKYIVFDGGEDVSPIIYNEKNTDSSTSFTRDLHELGLLQVFMKFEIPIIGICRGSQFINSALGGSLIQNVHPKHSYLHEVKLNMETTISDYLHKDHIIVNSLHHQASKTLADGLIPTMTNSVDGIIEGYESIKKITINGKQVPMIKAVQSHPEYEDERVYAHRLDILKYLFSL